MRRHVLGVAAAVASLTMLATACSGGDSETGGSGAPSAGAEPTGTISIWARDSQQGFMSKLVELYNANHAVQAKVKIIPASRFVQKLGTAAS